MYIGKSLRSKEAPRHVSGRGRFVDDFTLPRMLHACILRSPYAHAKILGVDVAAAAALPGPVLVMLGKSIGRVESRENRAARRQHG